MNDQEFEELVERLREKISEVEQLQRIYRNETGVRYQTPFLLGGGCRPKAEAYETHLEGI